VVASLLVHVTVEPTATVTGLGAKAVVVNADAPLTIDIDIPDPVGVVGVGVVDEDDEQAAVKPNKRTADTMRRIVTPFAGARKQIDCRHACAARGGKS
jgi:hypothetical protein